MSRFVTAEELGVWKTVQQKTPAWYKSRNQLLTASDIPAVMELSPFKTKYELFQSKLDSLLHPEQKNEISNPAVDWGQYHEPLARSFYEIMPLANGPRYVHEVGLIRHPKYHWLGASPDGVVQSKNKNTNTPWWLLEIKCPYRRLFHDEDKSIPLYIWVQIQIQLEVCDLSVCHLLQCRYEKIDNESKLVNRKLSTVKRSKEWFNTVALPELKEFWELLQRATQYEYVTKPYPNPREWVSMKSFTGYLLSDPIIDWLNEYKNEPVVQILKDPNDFGKVAKDRMKEKDNLFLSLGDSFKQFCLKKGYEMRFVTPIEERDRESLSVRRFKQTKSALDAKVPVISRPVLLNYGQKTHGIADMLVRNDVALEFIKSKYATTTTDLGFLETSVSEFKETGYVLFCFTLRSCFRKKPISDEERAEIAELAREYRVSPRVQSFAMPPPAGLRRSGRIAVRDERIFYDENSESESESEDSEENGPESKVVFRKWDKVLRARYAGYAEIVDALLSDKGPCTLVAFMGSWFCHIANPIMVDYVKSDVMDGAKWARNVKNNGLKWLEELNPKIVQPSERNLMPNMCNKYDQRWRSAKQLLAERWGELTLLWYCGVDQRRRAHEKGIYSWKNDISSSSIVESFYVERDESKKKGKRAKKKESVSRRRRIMGAMIRLNRTKDKVFRSYHTGTYEEPYLDIPEKTKEFFVDFEVIPYNKNETATSDRLRQPAGMIYLIGMGWIDERTNEWKFKSFVASALTAGAEKKMMTEWWKTIRSVKRSSKSSKAVLYHWSPAEPRFMNKVMDRNPHNMITDDIESGRYEYRDMMEMFLDAEVVVRGVWGYSVKALAKGLYKHGLLQEIWEIGEKGNKIDSGEGTLATATGCYRSASKYNIDVGQVPEFSSLRVYNEMDCRVMYDLLMFLRNHIYSPREKAMAEQSPMATKGMDEIWGLPPPLMLAGHKSRKRGRDNQDGVVNDTDNEKDENYDIQPKKKKRRSRSKRGKSRKDKDK